MVLIEDNSTD